MSTKFAPRLRARAISKSKSLKTGMFGALLEVELDKICTTPARESDSEVKIVKTWHARSTLPRLRARTIWKSKPLKHQALGTFLEVESPFCAAGAGNSTACKIRGRRRSSWGLQKRWQAWWIWRGSETMRFAWQAQGFCGLWCRCLKHSTQNLWKGCKFHVTEVLLCSDHFAWQLQDFVCLGSTFSWQVQYFWSIHLKITKTYWNSEAKCLVNLSFLKEVSQKCFVFDLQSFVFEGSLAEKLRLTKSFESHISWQPNHLNLKSIDNQITWISDQLTTESLESQFNHITWSSNQQTTKIIWSTHRLTTKSFESQFNWQANQLNLKSTDNQNRLNLKSIHNQITWISLHLNLTSIHFRTNWTPHPPFL